MKTAHVNKWRAALHGAATVFTIYPSTNDEYIISSPIPRKKAYIDDGESIAMYWNQVGDHLYVAMKEIDTEEPKIKSNRKHTNGRDGRSAKSRI